MSILATLTPLERLALQIALEAPERRNKYANSATVSWETVDILREELERRGLNWKAGVRRRVEIGKETRAARAKARS